MFPHLHENEETEYVYTDLVTENNAELDFDTFRKWGMMGNGLQAVTR